MKYLLKKGATIPHSKWRYWHLIRIISESSVHFIDFIHALELVFSESTNVEYELNLKPEHESTFTKFHEMLRDVQDPNNINDIFFTFVRYKFVSKDIFESFLECGFNINSRDRYNRNAVHVLLWQYKNDPCAMHSYIVKCITFLLRNFADPNNVASDATFPLALVIGISNCNIKVMKILLEAGANPDKLTANGLTPLHLCIKSNMNAEVKYDAVSLLLKFGAKCDLKDRRGKTYGQIILEQPVVQCNILVKLSKYPLHDCLNSALPEMNKISLLQLLLNQHDVDINIKDTMERTPLLLSSCELLNSLLTETLLELGADVNIRYDSFSSILQKLLLSRHQSVADILRVFLNTRQISNHANNDGDTLLITALKANKRRFTEWYLILNAVGLESVSIKNKDLKNSLHLCAECHFLTDDEASSMCEIYLSVSPDVSIRDSSGKTPLEYASSCARRQRTKMIRLLLKHSVLDEIGSIFLLNLINHGHMCKGISDELDRRGYYNHIAEENIDIMHELALTTPATIGQIEEPIRCFLKCDLNIDRKDNKGNSALILACKGRLNIGLVSTLIKNGADVNLQNEDGNTALHSCIQSPVSDSVLNHVCLLFKEYEFDFIIRNACGQTVLFAIIDKLLERKQTFETLINLTNDINFVNFESDTILHKLVAVNENDTEVSSWLNIIFEMHPNINVDAQGEHGRTVLNTACCYVRYSRFQTISLLINHGANINTRDEFGLTPFQNVLQNLKGHDLPISFERFVRILLILFIRNDLEVVLPNMESNKYHDITSIVTEKTFQNATKILKIMVDRISKKFTKRINSHMLKFEGLSDEMSNLISKANGRVCHLKMDIDDNDSIVDSDFVENDTRAAIPTLFAPNLIIQHALLSETSESDRDIEDNVEEWDSIYETDDN